MSITIDVAMAMSGSEAVVERYYSVMKRQTLPGGQMNETLVLRTNIDWCFPMPSQCEETIKEIDSLYIKGNKDLGLRPHQIPVFLDQRDRPMNSNVLIAPRSTTVQDIHVFRGYSCKMTN